MAMLMDTARTVDAFRGLTYSLGRYGGDRLPDRVRTREDDERHPGRLADVTELVCPPYDVIGEEQRAALLERDTRNAIRLEFSAAPDPYAAAAAALEAWTAEGTLERGIHPSVYYYSHAIPSTPSDPVVNGVVVRVLLEPWGRRVRPHERTMHGPKKDRLALLRATRTQLSPILAVYFDRSERYRHVMSRPWTDEWRARDDDGLLHQLAAVEPDERLLGYLGKQTLFIADGHHRYETALAYRDEVRALPEHAGAPEGSLAADWVMAVLVNAELEELEIRPTHRLLRGLDQASVDALAEGAAERWEIERVAPEGVAPRLAELESDERAVVGLVVPNAGGFVLVGRPDALDERMQRERASTAVRRLDLAVLHAAIFRDLLGFDVSAEAAGERILYTKDAAEAVARASRGDVQAAFLVRPTRIDQLAAVAGAGDVMPQKSTYFYPKLLTGMVFNSLKKD